MTSLSQPTEETTTMRPRELTLIVAATNQMGIGLNNSLPWKSLKKEMAYFARVTKRAPPNTTNSIIMGRKTWDSLPRQLRPLKDRTNIVITRSDPPIYPPLSDFGPFVVNSIAGAIKVAEEKGSERIFVIGGAEIYKAALEMGEAKRVLLTRIKGEFECDVHFPLGLGEDGKAEGWKRGDKQELNLWVGEDVPGEQEEAGTKYEFEMWERVED